MFGRKVFIGTFLVLSVFGNVCIGELLSFLQGIFRVLLFDSDCAV